MAKKIKPTEYPTSDHELTAEYLGKFIRAKRNFWKVWNFSDFGGMESENTISWNMWR